MGLVISSGGQSIKELNLYLKESFLEACVGLVQFIPIFL